MRQSPLDTRPERRALRVYAFDPMLARGGDLRVTVEVPYREILHEPEWFGDDRLAVIDYDASSKRVVRAVRLDDPGIAMQSGLDPSESDPQFHQQMVYAVASRVLESFDRALGRRLSFRSGQRLRLLPHAFRGRNAYYDDQLSAVLFGYFEADRVDPGENLRGQLVFTCLSHDIVAHEVAHAALDRLHGYYNEPTNPEVPALHEGFADTVAIFLPFTYPEVVQRLIRQTRGDLLARGSLALQIGRQFGQASGLGGALRSVGGAPDPGAFARTWEPHALGRLLVSAIFEAFVRTCERRTADLVRLATGGSGQLPEGELHPDLVVRLASEYARTASSVLSMCIRATDYMPPVDPTFSDFLRALVTADFELNRADEIGLRASMIEAFRVRGIEPRAVGSLAVESLYLVPEDALAPPDHEIADVVATLLLGGARDLSRSTVRSPSRLGSTATKRRRIEKAPTLSDWVAQQQVRFSEAETIAEGVQLDEEDDSLKPIGAKLGAWAKAHRQLLRLRDDLPIRVSGFHPVHRVAPSGELLVEMVAKLVQTERQSPTEELPYRAGTTIIASAEGRIRYVIAKPFQPERAATMRKWVARFDAERGPSWPTETSAGRLREAFSARAMDARRLR